jgi:hypothetical protein
VSGVGWSVEGTAVPLLLLFCSLLAPSSSRLLFSLPLTTTAPLSLYLCIQRGWKEFKPAARHLPGCAGWLRDYGDSRQARALPRPVMTHPLYNEPGSINYSLKTTSQYYRTTSQYIRKFATNTIPRDEERTSLVISFSATQPRSDI